MRNDEASEARRQELRDEYVAERTKEHIRMIRNAILCKTQITISIIDYRLSALSWDAEMTSDLIYKSTLGANAYWFLVKRAIEDEAAERAERDASEHTLGEAE